jgi:hypothetical protein
MKPYKQFLEEAKGGTPSKTKEAIRWFLKDVSDKSEGFVKAFENRLKIPDNEEIETPKGKFTGKQFSSFGGGVAGELDRE